LIFVTLVCASFTVMGPPLGQALEYISSVLSQRGPQAVPYAERSKWTIREHLSDLLKA
jgi:hypothetical protein